MAEGGVDVGHVCVDDDGVTLGVGDCEGVGDGEGGAETLLEEEDEED